MLSCVILTKNEEESIEKTLKNLSFCDEIIIVDDYSEDKTLTIAKKFTQEIFRRRLNNDFSQQRNFGLLKAKRDWVLFVDADEVVPASLKQEIIKTIKQNRKTINGYFIKREDVFLGKRLQYGETGNIKLIRLAMKGKGFWKRPVHEVWDIKGKVEELKSPLMHFPHQNVKSFLKKINYYSTINANYLFRQKKSVSAMDIFIYPITKFILNFLLKKGFLDGFEGFLLATFMSFHSFLTRSKLYLLKNSKHA